MIKIFNLSKILIILIILQFSFTKEEYCKISQNNLIVPESGCTLMRGEQTIVKDIILKGELQINKRNHLKYEHIKVESKKAGIKITSNYEKIILEDISTDDCSLDEKININFASSAKNELFDIEHVEQNTYKIVNRLPNMLYRGAEVIIFNTFESKLTKVIEISGENVILQDELAQNESNFYKKTNSKVSKIYHQLLLLDDNKIIFKNNCLFFQSDQTLFGPSHGAIFFNQRGLKYLTDLKKDVINLSDIIVFDSKNANKIQSNIEIQANMKDIILMGQGKSIQLNTVMTLDRLLIIHQLIFELRVSVHKDIAYKLNDIKIYGSNGKVLFAEENGYLKVKNIVIANSQLAFEVDDNKTSQMEFEDGVLNQSSIDKWIGIQSFSLFNFVIQSELNISSSISCSVTLQNCDFDGTGLEGAIRINQKLIQQIDLIYVKFSNFEKAKYPLIYSLTDKESFVQPFTNKPDHKIQMFRPTFAFDTTHKKFTNLQSLSLIAEYFLDSRTHMVTGLDQNLYSKKNLFRYKNPFFSQNDLTLFQNFDQSLRTIEFRMENGASLYEIVVEIQGGKTSLNFGEQIHLLSQYEYKIYFKLKENQFAPPQQKLSITTINFTDETKYKDIRIFFDTQQPLSYISGDYSRELFSFNPSDCSISLYFPQLDRFTKVDDYNETLTLDFCIKGYVVQDGECQISCQDETINPYQGACIHKTSHPRYYQTIDSDNKINFNSCSWYCIDCNDNSSCNRCIKNSEENNCQDEEQGYFVSQYQKIKKCQENCYHCDSQQKCNICNQNMGVDGDACKPLNSNQYIIFQEIQNCPIQCKKCYSSDYCSECQDGYQQILGQCIKTCEIGYFSEGMDCTKCSQNEKKCDDELNKTCYQGYVLNKETNACEESKVSEPRVCDGVSCYPCSKQTDKSCQNPYPFNCEKGQYYSFEQQLCLQCNQSCQECESDGNQCTKCAQNYIFINGVCSQCPEQHIIINNQCQKCPDGYFSKKGEDQCHQCDAKCKECSSSSDNCISCKQTYYLENKQCLPCSENCQECKDSSFCQICKSDDYSLQENTCTIIIESDSSLTEGEIIGIVFGVLGALIVCFFFMFVTIRQLKSSKRCQPTENINLQAKVDQGHAQINIPTQTNLNYNVQTLENFETQQIYLPKKQNNEILQTITSI